jgi:hypothetical protein
MQNPLANPDVRSYQAAKNTRLLKIERASMKVVGESIYTLDDPATSAAIRRSGRTILASRS